MPSLITLPSSERVERERRERRKREREGERREEVDCHHLPILAIIHPSSLWVVVMSCH